ncbi:DUF2878 domain-containing protein [Vibrio sp. T187]|uniref:DUF2878 domain-containing protein n=1 Tax=Vibrio TaxID=662 RepID=UPI0010C94DB3|nr:MULTISPECIES: DUF2878 domain-containing protein [Vibrio]MBW3696901.1 DUF2878 domain-containing protein [Vibrio sp. T187]
MKAFWLINLVLFQASWFCAAFATEYASLVIACLLVLHFYLSPSRSEDLKIMPLALIGIVVDQTHLLFGTFSADSGAFPLWLVLLWLMFVVSFNHSLSWFYEKHLIVLIGFGGVGGTLSYLGGIKAGALGSALPTSQLVISLALSWAILFPVLMFCCRYIKRTFNMSLSS